MKRRRRKRKPQLPKCRPLDQLEVGQPFNPLRLFVPYSVTRAIAASRKMGLGTKLVLIVLTDQCRLKGYDYHTHANLAEMLALSRRQLERHLAHLKKLKLIHVEAELGRPDYTWLLYHPLFASCSPWTPVTSDVPPTTQTTEGVRRNSHTHGKDHGKDALTDAIGLRQGTSYRGDHAQNGENKAKTPANGNPSGKLPITDRAFTLQVKPDHRQFFYSLTAHEKRRRYDAAGRLLDELAYFEKHRSDADHAIKNQAEIEIGRRRRDLSDLGFWLATPAKE
jgi:DNA-binding transcriptional ArsR family regulator